jgi:hypothetical protein
LEAAPKNDLFLYTHHEVFFDAGVIKHTRSSPQWEAGVVTYSTCKHLLRTYNRVWEGTWLCGLCPAHCEANTVMFAGQVRHVFDSNYDLRTWLRHWHPKVLVAKLANTNPRGDCYTPSVGSLSVHDPARYAHTSFQEPPNHTRSIEFYKKSPGSVSDRPDGKIPKWWRDLEYIYNGRRPPSFILSPVFLFSKPQLWTSYRPRRAVLKLTPSLLAQSLAREPVKEP